MSTQLTTPEKLRLRSAFERWQSRPRYFSEEIRAAEQALSDAQKYGWKLSVGNDGVPVATAPKNMTLSRKELSRFMSKIPTMTTAEQASTKSAFSAIRYRSFSASVDSKGKLVARPPKSKLL